MKWSTMLRISQINGPHRVLTLKVEGKILGPWVDELSRACAEDSLKQLSLDLSQVTFVDAAGVELLRQLLKRGVTLAACSGLVAALLHVEGR
jgi:anti-anti-sigma regulatory factor